eukprot:2513178-Rhodomonas_salina.2
MPTTEYADHDVCIGKCRYRRALLISAGDAALRPHSARPDRNSTKICDGRHNVRRDSNQNAR